MAGDPFDLQRFVDAQRPVIDAVRRELAGGRKRTHWMWFVFPQLAGLGSSPTSRRYAVRSMEEARAYLAHPVLGPRLVECVKLVNGVEGRTALEIFGSPDDMKFRSCLTLFELVSDDAIFVSALERYFGGARDGATLELLAEGMARRPMRSPRNL